MSVQRQIDTMLERSLGLVRETFSTGLSRMRSHGGKRSPRRR